MSLETARCRGEAESEAHPGRRLDDRQRTVLPDPASRHVRSWRESSSIEDVRSKERLGAIRAKKNSQLPITGSAQERSLKVGSPSRRRAGAEERPFSLKERC